MTWQSGGTYAIQPDSPGGAAMGDWMSFDLIIDEQDRGILLEAIELVLVLAADEGREVTVGEVTLGLFNEYVSGERDPAKMAEAVMNAPRRVLH
jgi:hypothetical protein